MKGDNLESDVKKDISISRHKRLPILLVLYTPKNRTLEASIYLVKVFSAYQDSSVQHYTKQKDRTESDTVRYWENGTSIVL